MCRAFVAWLMFWRHVGSGAVRLLRGLVVSAICSGDFVSAICFGLIFCGHAMVGAVHLSRGLVVAGLV